jgi:hypothetical protein
VLPGVNSVIVPDPVGIGVRNANVESKRPLSRVAAVTRDFLPRRFRIESGGARMNRAHEILA